MSKRVTHFLFAFLFIASFAPLRLLSQTYGNEWIDYSKTYFKIKVAVDGLYRIPYSLLQSETVNGLNVNTVPGSSFTMFHNGQVSPIYVTTTGIFGDTDYIEFYGQHNDGTLDAPLYDSAGILFPNWQPNPYYSLFNDTSAYYLTWNTTAQNILITNVANSLTNLPPAETYCTTTLVENYNAVYSQGRPYYLQTEPLYESTYDEGEGYTNYPFKNTSITTALPTPAFYNSGGVQASLRFSVVAMTNDSHALAVNFNSLPQLANVKYFGFKENNWSWSFPASSLASTNNLVLTASGSTNNDVDAIAFIALTYPNTFGFGGMSMVNFSISGTYGDKYFEISAYNNNNTAPILYDLTNNIRIVGQGGSPPYQFHLPNAGGGATATRNLFLTSQGGTDIQTVSSLDMIRFVDFSNPQNQGDFVIITDPSLQNYNGVDYVTEYATYRKSAAGGSHNVPPLIYPSELYDEFGYGIEKDPIAIRSFIRYASAKWTNKPKFIFLVGKGREYANTNSSLNMRQNAATYASCLIPTYGYPGSDHLLAAPEGSITPLVPISRLSAVTGSDVMQYLLKVEDYEQQQAMTGDPYQTIANKQWTKEVLHLGGGLDASEQATFKYYLSTYQATIQDTSYGAFVTNFYKTSSAPIQLAQSDSLTNRINNGISIMTFFGHSSPNSFDFSVDNPDVYLNYHKYPLVISNGCFTGDIFNPTPGISEAFVINQNKGAIGFLATPALSSSSAVNLFSTAFYQNIDSTLYNQSVGATIQKSVNDVYTHYGSLAFNRMSAEGMFLHGDCSVKINTYPYPDYDLEAQNVSFSPSVITVQTDTFKVNVIIANLGKAITDSIYLQITRTFPNGTTNTFTKKVNAPYFQDTVVMSIPTGGSTAFGLNNLELFIDATDIVKHELSKTNNKLGIQFNVLSNDVFPIYPYDFSIVPKPPTLNASTANAFAPVHSYFMQIDTTTQFNSHLFKSFHVVQTGGLLQWTPSLNYHDSIVYYWRVGLDTLGEGNPRNVGTWHNWSFLYLSGDSGWNQSHYYQYIQDSYNNMYIDATRIFKFVGSTQTVSAVAGTSNVDFACGPAGSVPDDEIGYFLNGAEEQRWDCGGTTNEGGGDYPAGITFAVFDSLTGQPWISYYANINYNDVGCTPGAWIDNTYKSIHCKQRDVPAFDFPTSSCQQGSNGACWQQRIVNFIDSVPNGDYILAYSVNDPQYQYWIPQLVNAFTALGSKDVTTLVANGVGAPWAFFAKKGHPSTASEKAGVLVTDVVNFSDTFSVNWYTGSVTSPIIGPALKWQSLHWQHFPLEHPTYDQQTLEVIGIQSNGIQTVLYPHVYGNDTTLANINPKTYPNLMLVLNTTDDSAHTPTQLKFWRVTYEKVPEAALNPHAYFQFHADTLNFGDNLTLSVALQNVTNLNMDSMLVKYSIQNATKGLSAQYIKYDSLRAFKTLTLNYSFNTGCVNCLSALNNLTIEANPNNNQPEQWHFNNIGVLPFSMKGNNLNPLLDVTFDQVHILNGDLVSAKPDIVIRLKSENKFLALNDTSCLNTFIVYPDGTTNHINYSDPTVTFTPAIQSQVATNNVAQVEIKKSFTEDGTYELQVQGQDRSGNESGTYGGAGNGIDYYVQFEVVNKSTITNVLTYPNPFTTSTRFVFTLTGSQIPTFFKIQIMTVSGKIVREIMKDELGPIHIGTNISQFAWDGTDQYGGRLGNGLYLYRVVTSINGQAIANAATEADQYFKSGFGKMYLAR